MTASEIVMKRDDLNIAWGFRLTGGADLGTPFFVVKVLGRGHAERAGLRVGDMVYAINHKYINKCTHKDAQNMILHTGDTLVLNIRRGPFSGRGTPLPEYVDPLMGLAPPPETEIPELVPLPPYEPPVIVKDPTPPESEDEEAEETVVSFSVKINPRGQIAAIEELPVTPPPSRSPSRGRSRSRSASRDRRRSSSRRVTKQQNTVDSAISESGEMWSCDQASPQQLNSERSFAPISVSAVEPWTSPKPVGGIAGPEETFTYSKEVVTQYSTVLSAGHQSDGQTSEMVNESFIIHGGSQHKMEDILSPEDIERDIFEEKMEEQKITELLTGEAELLDQGVVGINFQKIIPKTDFIKDSEVFKELQGQIIKKEEPEEVQLKKDPNKRFSTFLQTPKRPVQKPKTKPPPVVTELPWAQQPSIEPIRSQPPQQWTVEDTESRPVQEATVDSSMTWTHEEFSYQEEMSRQINEEQVLIEEVISNNEELGQSEAINLTISEERVRFREEADANENVDNSSAEKPDELCEAAPTVVGEEQSSSSPPEHKSEFERQLDEVRKQMEAIQQLPSILQANLLALQEQLNKIVQAKTAADLQEVQDSVQKVDVVESHLSEKIDAGVEGNNEEPEEEFALEEIIEEGEAETKSPELEPEYGEIVEPNHNGPDVQYENQKNLQHCQKEEDNPSVVKPPMLRKFPCNVTERPIVLPGGRKWYKPRDAYNEDFIAETIIHQSEVLVGTAIGMNFLKYEPPKFDAENSAVYRLVSELEGRKQGVFQQPIEARPEKVLAADDYFPPISKRHFFAAKLTEQIEVPENIDKILQDVKGDKVVTV